MTKLMYIEASPRGGEAASTKVAEAYLAAIRSGNPDLEVDVYKLWDEKLPDFDGDKVAAKMQVLMGQNTMPPRRHCGRRSPPSRRGLRAQTGMSSRCRCGTPAFPIV